MAPAGASLPRGDNANRCAQAGIIPSVSKCTYGHTTKWDLCGYNTRPGWWLIYFITRDLQGFSGPLPLFIKFSHLGTFASWLEQQQSQENRFPPRTGKRRKGKRKEQKNGERSVVGSMVQKIVFIECCVAHISCRHR